MLLKMFKTDTRYNIILFKKVQLKDVYRDFREICPKGVD